jgi:hypothetical protein
MRHAKPLQWIEQREAREVLATARFERAPNPPWHGAAAAAVTQSIPRLRSWFATRHPMGLLLPPQPTLVPAPVTRRKPNDEDGYSSCW